MKLFLQFCSNLQVLMDSLSAGTNGTLKIKISNLIHAKIKYNDN